MTPESPTCLITGALGFLGSHMATEFSRHGYRVVGVGREEAPPEGLDHLGISAYTSLDLPGPQLSEILTAESPSVIVHAAGPASVANSMADPVADFHGTVGVLFHLLADVRRDAPDARVVILSSAAVYGDPESLPVSEDARLAPVSPYGFHKQIAENVLREFSGVYGVRTAAARIFSAYGAGLRRQILWDACEKARTGAVDLFGTGDETRDFIHAADVARAVRAIVEHAPMTGEAYNVASGEETTIRSLAEKIVEVVAPGTPIRFSGVVREGDPLRWRADISAIRALGFTPAVPLGEGVADYGAWYRRVQGDE